MGGTNSKKSSSTRPMPYDYARQQYQPQTGFAQQPYYTPQHPQFTSSPSSRFYSAPTANARPSETLDRKYARIADDYRTLDEVTTALAEAGLESSNLIVGIDFTKSNEWTGARSFNRRCLHNLGNKPNPYEEAISIIGQTLSAFDDDNLIPCFGFGDASTHDQDVFSFYDDKRYCQGFEEVLSRYRELAPQLRLAGPTSFAPLIEMATTIVEQSGGQYHVLLIIADGQVTRSVDTEPGHLSPQEQNTVDAMVRASAYPLSIVLVGVGDGPWDMMIEFDDNVPSRAFDNFQFVNFTKIMSKNADMSRKHTEFALSALMEIPSQYKATIAHGLLGRRTGHCPERVPLPPPRCSNPYTHSRSFKQSDTTYSRHDEGFVTPNFTANAPPPTSTYNNQMSDTTYSRRDEGFVTPNFTANAPPSTSTYNNQLCPVCFTSRKDMAFGCGHQTCCDCGQFLDVCPICRCPINVRIRLF
ncbi:hypothetical protein RND81_11G011400 [Saponaria officinalis]|uniref:RING-type domain-containing protein n=1 Tax=Saponaria officinalis TaxID=3572 RepID=A0AAW1HI73_SAPOF